jgi:hypothetical protein
MNVFAVQCPKCRKFMLVEAHDQGKIVACLLCKSGIKIGTSAQAAQQASPRRK